jgi:hypothetical protein
MIAGNARGKVDRSQRGNVSAGAWGETGRRVGVGRVGVERFGVSMG